MSELIGRVVWGEDMVTAEYRSDGTWKAHIDGKPLPDLAASLAGRYADFRGPAEGIPGHHALRHLAEKTGGTLVLEDHKPPDPFTVY